MKTIWALGIMVLSLAFWVVTTPGARAGEDWIVGEYGYEEMGPATSGPFYEGEEMAPAVPGWEQGTEEMSPSSSAPETGIEEMAPADPGLREEEYQTPENAPYKAPARSEFYY